MRNNGGSLIGLACLVGASCLILSLMDQGSAQDRTPLRAAILPTGPKSGSVAAFLDLLLVRLSQDEGFECVERERIDQVLDEQALQRVLSGHTEGRIRLGRILRADLLVLASQAQSPEQIRFAIIETRYGLRLLDQDIESPDEETLDLAMLMLQDCAGAIRSKPRTVYSMPPLASEEVSFEFDPLQEGLALLLRKELLSRARWVVEFQEARRILDEMALTNGPKVERPEVTIVEGRFSRSKRDKDGLDLRLTLRGSKGQIREVTAVLSLREGLLAQGVRRTVDQILDAETSRSGAISEEPGRRSDEFDWLVSRAGIHQRFGCWEEARQELEASLLLRPTSEVPRVPLMHTYMGLAEVAGRGGLWRGMPSEKLIELFACYQRGLGHAEWLLRNQPKLSPEAIEVIRSLLLPWCLNAGDDFPMEQRIVPIPIPDPELARIVSRVCDDVRRLMLFWAQQRPDTLPSIASSLPSFVKVEPYVLKTPQEKYAERLSLLQSLERYGPTLKVGFLVSSFRPQSSAEKPAFVAYLREVSRSLKGEARATALKVLKAQSRPAKAPLPPAEPVRETPPGEPAFTVPSSLLRVEPLDALSKLDVYGGNGRSKKPSFLPAGEEGEALWISNKRVYFLRSPSDQVSVMDLSKEQYKIIYDVRWDKGVLWMLLGPAFGSPPEWEVRSWRASNSEEGLWGADQGLPLRVASEGRDAAPQWSLSLCPLNGRAFVAAGGDIRTSVSRAWVAAIDPGQSQAKVIFTAKAVQDTNQSKPGEPEARLDLGFIPGVMEVIPTGQTPEDLRIVIQRKGITWALSLQVNPFKDEVTVCPFCLDAPLAPFVVASQDPFLVLEDSRIKWRSRSMGEIVAEEWTGIAPCDAFTFEGRLYLHGGERPRLDAGKWVYEGKRDPACLAVVSEEDHRVFKIIPDMSLVDPALVFVGHSRFFGLVGFDEHKGKFKSVHLDPEAVEDLIAVARVLGDR